MASPVPSVDDGRNAPTPDSTPRRGSQGPGPFARGHAALPGHDIFSHRPVGWPIRCCFCRPLRAALPREEIRLMRRPPPARPPRRFRRPVPDSRPQVVYAAGDLSDCPGTGPAVADLIRNPESLILALGDIVHPSGALHEYQRCFDPGWGDLKALTRPVPGNHDYHTGGAGYFAYFGASAGKPSQGYYSFDLGWWHIIADQFGLRVYRRLSGGYPADPMAGGRLGRPSDGLYARVLASPTFLIRQRGRAASDRLAMAGAIWAGADVILNGHDHDYERFAPQTRPATGHGTWYPRIHRRHWRSEPHPPPASGPQQ